MSFGGNYPDELEITAYHEAGHAVAARVLRKPIRLMKLSYSEQTRTWVGGETFKDELPTNDRNWLNRNVDRYIPYEELEYHYPRYPEPYEEYKRVRELCAIDYAGMVVEELLFTHRDVDVSLASLEQNAAIDIYYARRRIEKFPSEGQDEELDFAKSRARAILSNGTCWNMVVNLAEKLINDIRNGRQPDEQIDFTYHWYFSFNVIYESFQQTLIPNDT